MIDLRSDTATQPAAAMRRAIVDPARRHLGREFETAAEASPRALRLLTAA